VKSAFCAVAVALAACGSGAVQPAQANLPLAPGFRAAGPMPAPQARPPVQSSWMSPDAKNIKSLLYVAGAVTGTVYVYDFKTRELVGEIAGFDQPNGECVDANGDIWITDYMGGTVSEYAHGGSTALKTLRAGTLQTACSIDPVTGDLAVGSFSPGEIYVWKKARGTPKIYASSACPSLWGPGYDNRGNLFVEAAITGSAVFICWVPHGGNSLTIIPFNQTVNFGADVMWDGKYITFADQSFGGSELQAGVYQAKLNASGGLALVGKTALPDPCGHSDVIQPFIVGRKNTPNNSVQGFAVTGSNNSCLTNVDIWPYPAGGNPDYIINAPEKVTFGTAVSIKE
jgi:hypothetical protein